MRPSSPPEQLTEEERTVEIAAIFARGILRLQKHRSRVTDSNSEELPKSPPQGLELSREMRLSVPTG